LRSVTATPTGIPSRSLKAAMDLRARRRFGRWPLMIESSSMASSMTLLLRLASPIPMFRVTLTRRGADIGVE
jgi:hypothetical protein